MASQDPLTVTIIMVGDAYVGKSSLLVRYTDDKFITLQTTIFDMKTKVLEVDGKKVKLIVKDTAGTEKYRSVMRNHYRKAQGVILVYDVTNRKSFTRLDMWLNDVEAYTSYTEIVKILVGNKNDETDVQVTREEGFQFASRHDMLFIEASAKANDGVECIFEKITQKILQTPALLEDKKGGFNLKKDNVNNTYTICSNCTGHIHIPDMTSWFKK